MIIFFLKICIVREIKKKLKKKIEKKLNLSHAGLKSPDQNPDPEGAGLKPGPHPEKPGFNPGPGLYFSHPVRSRATPKPGPDPDFAKPKCGVAGICKSFLISNLHITHSMFKFKIPNSSVTNKITYNK